MGGQHYYFGLWLSTEFGKGHSKAKPTSTTYGSPQLSAKEDFLIDVVEAWGVGDEPKSEEEEESVSSCHRCAGDENRLRMVYPASGTEKLIPARSIITFIRIAHW